jgi:hypothetical protein
MRRALCQAVFVLAATWITATSSFAFTTVFTRTYPLHSGGRFQLENVNGSVQVDGWERQEVEIYAVKTSLRDPRDADLVKIEIESGVDGVIVHTRYPHGQGVDVAVEYRVHVPYRVSLKGVETVNGSVVVRGVEGGGELHSVNGNVEVLDSAGRFSARTTNGNLRLELRRLPDGDPMALETVNGSVLLALPPDAGADLDVRSMNGDFHSDLPVETPSSLSARALHGRLGAGGAEVMLRTINGGIRVVLERPGV